MPPEFVNLFLQIPLVGVVVWVVLYLNKEARNERDVWRAEIREMQKSWRDEISAWRKDSQENIVRLERAISSNTEVLSKTLQALDRLLSDKRSFS